MSYSNKGRTLILSVVGVLIAIVIGVLAGSYLTENNDQSQAIREAGIIILPKSRELPALQLTSTTGEQVLTQELTGKWSLVFFEIGRASCRERV